MKQRMISRCFFLTCVFLFLTISISIIAYSNEIIPLTDAHMIDFERCEIIAEKITDSYGNDYNENVMRFDAGWNGFASFDLDGAYVRITGAFVAADDTSSDAELNAAIFVDGVQCFSMSRYTKQQPKQEFDIDLSGACRLDIKTSNAYESNGKSLYLVETKFEKSGEVLPFTEWYSLRNTVLIDSHSYEATKSLGVDSYGELHNGSLRFDASHDSYALFNLNKQYHSFSASLAPGNDTSSDIKMDITIYCDDNVVFSEQGITRLDPKMAINLDVTDVGVLRVETDAEYDGNYDAYLYIYDDILK